MVIVPRASIRARTGVEFFGEFEVPAEAPLPAPRDFELGHVAAAIDGLQQGAGFVLVIRSGRLATLEGFSYDEPWPDKIRSFELEYWRDLRPTDLPELQTKNLPISDFLCGFGSWEVCV